MTPSAIPVGGTETGAPLWSERRDSGDGEVNFNNPTSELKFTVTNCFDVNDLIASAVPPNIPPFNVVGGVTQFFKSYKYTPASPTDGSIWEVVVQYGFQVNYFELSFDTSGAHTKVHAALDEGDYYDCINGPDNVDMLPSFHQMIGVDDAGKAEGVDVPTPKFDFTVLIRDKFSTLPSDYLADLKDLTGSCNDRPLTINWKGQVIPFDTEELLFLGVTGKMTSEDGFEITLKFSASFGKSGKGTQVTNDYTQPAVNGLVNITLDDVTGLAVSDEIYIVGGGTYQIVNIAGDVVTAENLGIDNPAAPSSTVKAGSVVSFGGDTQPLFIRESGPIAKPGHRYLWVQAGIETVGGRKVTCPKVAVVNQVVPIADLSPIGIFQ